MAFLNGVRVLSVGLNIPGPLACQRLASLGARVIKVEPPQGDPLKHGFPKWYSEVHENQTVVTLNLQEASDYNKFCEYIKSSDIFITSFRPNTVKKLKLDFESVKKLNSKICQIGIVGYPEPDMNAPSHDLTCQAKAGLILENENPKFLIADFVGAERVVSLCLSSYISMKQTGEGNLTWLSLYDGAQFMAKALAEGATAPNGILGGANCFYSIYETKEGRVALAALEPSFVEKLKKHLNLGSIKRDDLKKFFKSKTAAEWEEWGKAQDIPVCKVKDLA